MITGITESKALTKHLSFECKCKFDGKKCNSNQSWNNNKCRCECKNVSVKNMIHLKKNMFGILVNVFVKMENI